LARAYGINRTARALRLDYYSLKKHATAAAGSGSRRAGMSRPKSRRAAPEFVEILSGGMPALGHECLIEVEDAGGVKMRIRLPGGELPDVAALARVFREVAGGGRS
jgi:hypothetical protein